MTFEIQENFNLSKFEIKMGIFVTQTKLSYLWNGIREVW